MNLIIRFTFLIISSGIRTIHAHTQKDIYIMPGVSACMTYGSLDRCQEPIVPINLLPSKCTSYFMDGLFINKSFAIQNSYSNSDGEYIKELTKTNKPVFVFYGYQLGYTWSNVLDCVIDCKEPCPELLASELNAIKEYIKNIVIEGFVLKNVFEDGNANLENISKKLTSYVNYMKAGTPYISYGLEIDAKLILSYTNCPKSYATCINFNTLNEEFDFYVITLDNFNECSEGFKNGIIPVTMNNRWYYFNRKTGNTLTKLASALKDAGAPINKIYYLFSLNPQVKNHKGPGCNPTYLQKCKGTLNQDPKIHYDYICTENSMTLYEKGKFIKSNAAGFIGAYIDTDDVKGECHCSHSFPAFNFILNGYNGGEIQPCPLFDCTN